MFSPCQEVPLGSDQGSTSAFLHIGKSLHIEPGEGCHPSLAPSLKGFKLVQGLIELPVQMGFVAHHLFKNRAVG